MCPRLPSCAMQMHDLLAASLRLDDMCGGISLIGFNVDKCAGLEVRGEVCYNCMD